MIKEISGRRCASKKESIDWCYLEVMKVLIRYSFSPLPCVENAGARPEWNVTPGRCCFVVYCAVLKKWDASVSSCSFDSLAPYCFVSFVPSCLMLRIHSKMLDNSYPYVMACCQKKKEMRNPGVSGIMSIMPNLVRPTFHQTDMNPSWLVVCSSDVLMMICFDDVFALLVIIP